MKPIYVKGNADEAFYKKYADVCAKRQSLKDSIEELQDNIRNMSMNIIRNENRGKITQRQKEALKVTEKAIKIREKLVKENAKRLL